ncbi:uncharacterized protein LOC134242111 [Saccostrea cucullata]|uniref:uncharacterized protein LOC134242111 n=1 Tax=Saccostrea cuccullata TaxID=36930 RepID=UPI002ED2470F
MSLPLRGIIFCQVCIWMVESAPSLSKIEGVITPDESVQSLTNNIGNSIYTGMAEASLADPTATDLLNKRKGGYTDVSGAGDFSVTNTITSSKDSNVNRFDQTSPTINEVKPTVKAMKAFKKQKKPTKGTLSKKSERNNPKMSENTLLETFTTTTMSSVLDGETSDPFFDSFDNFETTTPFGGLTTTPLVTTTLPPLRPLDNKGPPTTTFTPCSANIRANPKNRNIYSYLSGPWSGYFIRCPAGLEFREDRCRCDWPLMEAVENCSCCKSGVMKHEKHRNMFKRLINGQWVDEVCQSHTMVWDDTECKCVWDANKPGREIVPVDKPTKYYPRYNERCVTLLNMTLDKELKDEDGKHITGTRKIHSRRFKAIKGAVNKAMLFVYTPFELQSFKGNSLERNIYISFNFKPVVQNAKKVTLFSNGCKAYEAIEQKLPPSIEINFFPHNETMEFIFKTESKSLSIYRKPRRDPYDWYRVRMYLQDKVLTIIINNEVLYNSNGLNGKIISTNCNLMVGGSPFNSEQKYIGYMDEILIVKQCPYAKKNNLGPQAG